MKNKAIIINQMFSGEYLKYNIGHEVINLFCADNGNFYVYLNPIGTIAKKRIDKVDWKESYVLLVRRLDWSTAEVIGLAKGLKLVYGKENQKEYADKDKIEYGGVSINEIYDGAEQQEINITFKAEWIKEVRDKDKRRIYLRCIDENDKEDIEKNKIIDTPILKKTNFSRDKNYITDKDDYNEIMKKLIEKDELWGEPMPKVSEMPKGQELNYLDICHQQYKELAYSNSMSYFVQKYPELAFAFFDKLTGKKNEHETFTALREEKHIDLLFYNSKRIVVVENKVKSGINGICNDENGEINSQLNKYVEAVKNIKGKDEFKNAEEYYFFLAPNYMPVDTDLLKFSYGEEVIEYKLIRYKDVYDFLIGWRENVYGNDPLFNQFVQSLKIHTTPFDDGMYNSTFVRFIERIQYIQRKKLYT